jgi:hypothetical protein
VRLINSVRDCTHPQIFNALVNVVNNQSPDLDGVVADISTMCMK